MQFKCAECALRECVCMGAGGTRRFLLRLNLNVTFWIFKICYICGRSERIAYNSPQDADTLCTC